MPSSPPPKSAPTANVSSSAACIANTRIDAGMTSSNRNNNTNTRNTNTNDHTNMIQRCVHTKSICLRKNDERGIRALSARPREAPFLRKQSDFAFWEIQNSPEIALVHEISTYGTYHFQILVTKKLPSKTIARS